MGPIFLALVMLAQGAAAPSTDENPRAPPTSQGPRLPFETGRIVFRVEIWMGGAMRCTADADRTALEATAAELCAGIPTPAPGATASGDLVSRVTTAITLTRAGDAAPASETSPDPQSYSTQAEIDVRSDGTVAACRLVNETRSAESAVPAEPDGICGDLVRSIPFQPWTGDGLRRGSIRLTIFSAGPDRLGRE